MNQNKGIALVLSGGGIRAMVFHLGLLQYLAERHLLEQVTRISTVSGGSLLVGLIFRQNGMVWPTSEQFISNIVPALKAEVCSKSMMAGVLRQLLNPLNWRFILSRANLLALALKSEWDVKQCLADIPKAPEWSINGTTAENGKRFRFKSADMGDWSLGYAPTDQFPLCEAMAVSAAFPVGFGPLAINPMKFRWMKRPWGKDQAEAKEVKLPFRRLHLWDGGVYDNLGLEPVFDAGRLVSKVGDELIFVSDGGAPLGKGFTLWHMDPRRLKRIIDIMSDQTRSLRVRTFAHYLNSAPERGAYLYIVAPSTNESPCQAARFACQFPTTLRKLEPEEFERIFNHGYGVVKSVDQRIGLESAGAISVLQDET